MLTIYKQIKNNVKNVIAMLSNDNEYFDYKSPLSNNNIILESLLDNIDEVILHNNCNLLADFNLNEGSFYECSLKDHNAKKLASWLNDQQIGYLFEHDFIIEKAVQYYKRPNSFYHEYVDEYYCELSDGLSFKDLTQKQIDKLESMLDVYIPEGSDNVFYVVGGMGFELTLPKAAILREYKAANSKF